MSKHTPTLWHAEIIDGEPIAITAMDGGRKIRIATMAGASSNPEIVADAKFLIRAVNAHDDLFASLNKLHALMDFQHDWKPCACFEYPDPLEDAMREAYAALQKAAGRS